MQQKTNVLERYFPLQPIHFIEIIEPTGYKIIKL